MYFNRFRKWDSENKAKKDKEKEPRHLTELFVDSAVLAPSFDDADEADQATAESQ